MVSMSESMKKSSLVRYRLAPSSINSESRASSPCPVRITTGISLLTFLTSFSVSNPFNLLPFVPARIWSKYNKIGVLIKVFQALFPCLIANHIIILPALKSIFQQVKNHFIVINEENKFTHRGIRSLF